MADGVHIDVEKPEEVLCRCLVKQELKKKEVELKSGERKEMRYYWKESIGSKMRQTEIQE